MTTTDSSGAFRFGSVPDGTYHVLVDPDDLLARRADVTIDTAHPTATADIAYPRGAVSGTVLFHGQPSVGATLTVHSEAFVKTDAAGNFIMRGLDEGVPYDVRVTSANGIWADFPTPLHAGDGATTFDIAPDVLRGTVHDHTGAPITGTFVAFNGREEPTFPVQAVGGVIDTPLPAGEYRLTYLPGGSALGYRFPQTLQLHSPERADFDLTIPEPGLVSGLIEIAPGVPVPAGMRVFLVNTDIKYSFSDVIEDNSGTEGLSTTTTTDLAGRYRFSNVWPGSYRVWWVDDALLQVFSASDSSAGKPLCPVWRNECPFPVAPGQNLDAVNGVRPAGVVTGVVSYRGAPVSGASVIVVDNIDEVRPPMSWDLHGTVRTASDGSFTVPGVAPGTYRLQIASDVGGAFSGPFTVGDQVVGPVRVSVGRAVLDGTVRLADGSPAQSGTVSVREVGADEHRPASLHSDGHFVMKNAPEGMLEVTVVAPSRCHGWWTSPTLVQTTETLRPLGLDLVVPEPGSVTGTITLPIPASAGRLTLSIDDPDGSPTAVATANADGTYSIESVLPGTYQLRVTSGSYPNTTTEMVVTVTVTSGHVTQADIGAQVVVLPATT